MTARLRWALGTGLVLCVGLAAQAEPAQPVPAPSPAPSPVAGPASLDPAESARAERLLAAHAERSRPVHVLTAQYVQRRTTKLVKATLESRGEFLFVRDPACVVFRAVTPRVSVVRLRAASYEVYRPQKHQLERFLLDGPELADGLFAAVGGDVERLRRDFEVRACQADPADASRVQIRLEPRVTAVRERLQQLVVTLREKDAGLCAVAYRDQAGDLVEIELLAVQANPSNPPSAEFDLPKDVTIVEHAPPKKGG